MTGDYWKKIWETGDTRFHRADVHPALVRYLDRLPPGKVLVPLCGKSHDLTWIARERKVVGVEIAEKACREYFAENRLDVTERREGDFTVFSSGNIEIYCGDYFRFRGEGIASAYDRAALVALPAEMRAKYARAMQAPAVLLVTFEFPPEIAKGPPFPVPEDEVRALFSDRYVVTLLERGPDPFMVSHPKFVDKSVPVEAVYLMEKI